MSRLTNDIDAVNQAVSQNVTTLLAGVLSLVGILVTMFALDVWLALASLLVVPIMFWFTQFVARYTRRGFRDLQKNLGELNAVMEEAIGSSLVTVSSAPSILFSSATSPSVSPIGQSAEVANFRFRCIRL